MRHSFIIAAFLAISAFPAFAQENTNAQYTACTQRVAVDAEDAYKRARAWYGQSGNMASQHCMALALFELKNYAEAATTLDGILKRLSPAQGKLWLNMKAQAARAHIAAGHYDEADTHVAEALLWAVDKNMDTETVPLLLHRAKIAETRGEYLKAVQDLDHALEITPQTSTRLQRARMFLKLGMKASARKDVEAVIAQEPKNEEALNLLALTSS